MVFHQSLGDSKSPQVSRNLLCVLAGLNKSAIWIVSTRPLISKFSSLFINPLVIEPRTAITICITFTLIFHSFFSSQARSTYIFLFAFVQFHSLVSGNSKVHNPACFLFFFRFFLFFFFLLLKTRSGRLAEIWWKVIKWNHIVVYKLSVLDTSSWSIICVLKLLALGIKTWNNIAIKPDNLEQTKDYC